MKIDLHVHASERSGCSVSTERDIVRAARRFGLDALAFTDHDRLVPPDELAALNGEFAPFRVFSGIEIHTQEEEDFLVFGIQDSAIENMGWSYPDLYRFVRARDGFIILAHPYRYRDTVDADVWSAPPDAVETRSTNINPITEPRIRDLVSQLGCVSTYSSDAHIAEKVGRYHVELEEPATDDRSLVRLLKDRRYACRILEERP
jgi:predicted metal-dependent phosphoesterase TrpH